MSTITKEWLRSQISAIKAVGITESNTLQAFEIALASLEAEPVACMGNGALYHSEEEARADARYILQPLYTAPPAPVSVPDEIESTSGSDYDDHYCDGWNACRAAMLQGGGRKPLSTVTAEHRRVIEMLLNVCGAAFELADDSCQQDVDGEECHVIPNDSFEKLSDALDEIENTLLTEDIDRQDVFLAWSAMPRAALKSILQTGKSPVIPDGLRLALSNAGIAAPESDEMLAATCEKHIQALVTWVKDRKPFQPIAPQQECGKI